MVAASGMLAGVLVDSDVLIWTLRGNPAALATMQSLNGWYISAVSYMELAQGCRNKAELKAIQRPSNQAATTYCPSPKASATWLACWC